MKQKHPIKRPFWWAIAYGLVLSSFTGFVLLKTFVLQSAEVTNIQAGGIYASSSSSPEASAEKETKAPGNNSQTFAKTEDESSEPATGAENDSSSEKESSSQVTTDNKATSQDTNNSDNSIESTTAIEKDTTVPSSDPIITDTSYQDSNISIQISQERVNDTTVYIADIQVSSVAYLKTALAQDSYGRNLKETTSAMAQEHNAILAINGDYYGFRDYGYVLRNGVLYRDTYENASDQAFVLLEDGNCEIVNMGDVSASELEDKGAAQILSFGPGLITDGELSVNENTEVDQSMTSNPRTAIGMVDPLHYVFVVSDGRTSESSGLTLYQLANVMKDYGCTQAYNLDGGGSSTMYFNGQVINNPTSGRGIREREVSDIVYIG